MDPSCELPQPGVSPCSGQGEHTGRCCFPRAPGQRRPRPCAIPFTSLRGKGRTQRGGKRARVGNGPLNPMGSLNLTSPLNPTGSLNPMSVFGLRPSGTTCTHKQGTRGTAEAAVSWSWGHRHGEGAGPSEGCVTAGPGSVQPGAELSRTGHIPR